LHPDDSAMLVSDPVLCQEGDGLVRFLYWTSPGVGVRVCFRRPGAGKRFDWCSAELTTGDPGPARITIPGSILHKFELVIEARNFIFQAFGMAGGLCVLDDISYTAKAVRNCRLEPHLDALIDLSRQTCMAVQCSFDEHGTHPVEECLRRNIHETPSANAVGNYHTGIRKPLASRYAYVHGPGAKVFWLSQFSLPRDAVLEFCYYRAFRNVRLAIYNEQAPSENRTQLYESDEIDSNPHEWVCDG
uniref:MAM domain-containing protein n=1 Tax=Anisakis simplex TaxID=6269 RepID=A0A0M3KHG0_ANISI